MADVKSDLRIDSGLRARLMSLSERRGKSLEDIAQSALAEFLEREEARDRLNQDARAAWADYCETGLHVTADEVDAWLACLEAGESVDPPAPHR